MLFKIFCTCTLESNLRELFVISPVIPQKGLILIENKAVLSDMRVLWCSHSGYEHGRRRRNQVDVIHVAAGDTPYIQGTSSARYKEREEHCGLLQ